MPRLRPATRPSDRTGFILWPIDENENHTNCMMGWALSAGYCPTVTDASPERDNFILPFGAAAASYSRLRFLPSAEALSWLLRGDERRVLDLAAGTGQVTGQLLQRGLTVVGVEPDEQMRNVFRTCFPGIECLDGTAEGIPLPDDSLDAVIVGSAWHLASATSRCRRKTSPRPRRSSSARLRPWASPTSSRGSGPTARTSMPTNGRRRSWKTQPQECCRRSSQVSAPSRSRS